MVTFADEAGGESPLCWQCIKKMANHKMRMSEGEAAVAAPQAPPIPTATPLALALKNAGNAVPAATK